VLNGSNKDIYSRMTDSRKRLTKTTLATAISLGVASLHAGSVYADIVPRNKFRLALDEEISSRPDQVATESFGGRLAMNTLIQSHPDPLYLALEERYEALPPFTLAEEEIPGQLIAAATLQDRLRDATNSVSRFVPKISTSIRQDDIDGTDGKEHLLVAAINPTFQYTKEQSKWNLNALYNLDYKQHYGDRERSSMDHLATIDYTLNLNRESDLSVSGIIGKSEEIHSRDPIQDFDSNRETFDPEMERYLISTTYNRGSEKDRTNYNIFYIAEQASLSGDDFQNTGYELDRSAFGGAYSWRMRRQLSLIAEGRYQSFDYDLPYRDNRHSEALVGTDLVIGRRLRARVRLGYETKDFDEGINGTSFGEAVWRGYLEWALNRRTKVTLETGREFYEYSYTDRPIDATQYNIRDWITAAWREDWSNQLSSQTSFTYRDADVEGLEGFGESAQQLIVSIVYRLSENIRFALDGAITRQDSQQGDDYNRRTFTFRTDYSLGRPK